MDIEKEREAFVKWFESRYIDDIHPDSTIGIVSWEAWQAQKAQAVPEWISTTDQLPVVKKCSEKLFNVVMLDYKSGPFVTSLTYMHEYEFYDSEDNFESERNEGGYVYHTGWVNHLNDDFFESIEADKVLYWVELPRVIEAQEQNQ